MDQEQEFLVDAQRKRDEQVVEQGGPHEVDPAIQAGIDEAMANAENGPEPGSEEPGFMGLGGLSKSAVEAQKQDIARRESAAKKVSA